MLGKRFPDFGFYRSVNVLLDGDPNFDEERMVGDAIDDLIDITMDLQSAAWLRDHGRCEEGAADLAWTFDIHWGAHLRNLQLYLHYRIRQ